jgi:N-acetylneuraminic acid mutarotase
VVIALLLASGVAWALTRGADGGAGTTNTSGTRSAGPSGGASSNLLGRWERVADLPVEVEAAAAAFYDGKLWVAGGSQNDAARTKLATTYIYDPASNKWSDGPRLPTPISHAAMVSSPAGLYLLGGWVQDGGTNQVLRYNPDRNAWDPVTPLPAPRVAGAAAWDGTQLLFAGGTGPKEVAANEIWALREGTWVLIGTLKRPRQKLAAVSNGTDYVLFLGGRDQIKKETYGDVDHVSHGKVLPTNLTVDPPREGAAAIKIQGVGICLIGGQSTDAYLQWWCENDAMVARLPKLDTPRAGMAAAVNGKTLYVVGGYNESPEVASSGSNQVLRLTVASPS